MKDNIILSDDTTTESSVESTIPAEMTITSWNVSVIVIKVNNNIFTAVHFIFGRKHEVD